VKTAEMPKALHFMSHPLLVWWPRWLKALAVYVSQLFSWSGLYTSLIGFNTHWLNQSINQSINQFKVPKEDELIHSRPSCQCKNLLLSVWHLCLHLEISRKIITWLIFPS